MRCDAVLRKNQCCRSERGFAALYVLVISVALVVVLTSIFASVAALHKQNMKSKAALKARCSTMLPCIDGKSKASEKGD